MRGVRRVLVTLVVLAGLLLVGDRLVVWAAQQLVADQVARELAAHQVGTTAPEVSIGGFPFVTQVAAGRYKQLTLRLRDVGSDGLVLPVVELTATDVTASAETLIRGEGPIHAERVSGVTTIAYSQVGATAGWDDLVLTADGDLVRIRLLADLAGVSHTVVGTATVQVSGHAIVVEIIDLTVEDGETALVAEPLAQLARELSLRVPLPPLPYDLSVDSVVPQPQGLVVTFRATHVPIVR